MKTWKKAAIIGGVVGLAYFLTILIIYTKGGCFIDNNMGCGFFLGTFNIHVLAVPYLLNWTPDFGTAQMVTMLLVLNSLTGAVLAVLVWKIFTLLKKLVSKKSKETQN